MVQSPPTFSSHQNCYFAKKATGQHRQSIKISTKEWEVESLNVRNQSFKSRKLGILLIKGKYSETLGY